MAERRSYAASEPESPVRVCRPATYSITFISINSKMLHKNTTTVLLITFG